MTDYGFEYLEYAKKIIEKIQDTQYENIKMLLKK